VAENSDKSKKKNKNIHPDPGAPVWNSDDPAGSLNAILQYVEAEASHAIEWYWRNKIWKSRTSRFIQFFAVVFAAAAGLVPIIAQLSHFSGDSGLWASLLVGLAAGLIGVDKAFGFSTGWARYVLTATAIRKALEEFRMDWSSLSAGASRPPNSEQVAAMIARAKEFSSTVEGLVTQETKDWVTEFQSSMAQLEKDVKVQLDTLKTQVEKTSQARQAATKPGSIELTVSNADKTDGFKFQVVVENESCTVANEEVTNSKTWARINTPPGHYKISVSGAAAGKPVGLSSVIDVKPGEAFKHSVELPLS
jgi:hypothetical protein